jgi:hypothetical protein
MERNGVHDRLPQSYAAVQYLTWALEEIEKFGHPKAALHARIALDELRGVNAKMLRHYAEAAKRFREADEVEQLAGSGRDEV